MYQNYNQQEIPRVRGRQGAEMYNLAPNSSVFLIDETTENVVWLKMTNTVGYPTIQPYMLTPYEEPKPVDVNDLLNRIAKLEERLNESDSKPAKPEEYRPKQGQRHDGNAK